MSAESEAGHKVRVLGKNGKCVDGPDDYRSNAEHSRPSAL